MSSPNTTRRTLVPPLVSTLAREVDQLQHSVRRMLDNPLGALRAPLAPLAPLASTLTIPEPIGWLPAVEIAETDAALTLTAELPGMTRDDVQVEVDGDVLTLRGEKRESRAEPGEDVRYHLVERSYGSFHRAFTLPATVDRDAITATFEQGVLTLALPKQAAGPRTTRTIEIGSA